MPGNFANTYFTNQLANLIAIATLANEINSGRLLTAVSGSNTTYTVDDPDPSGANYILYLPLPGVLQSSAGGTTKTTIITINNPNNLTIEIRTADWFSSPTQIISNGNYPNFGDRTSFSVLESAFPTRIVLSLYNHPINTSDKLWFVNYLKI